MSKYTSCISDIVKISHPDLCPSSCLPDAGELTDSTSGFYLNGYDEGAIDLKMFMDAYDCATNDDFWDKADSFKEETIDDFIRTLEGSLNSGRTVLYSDQFMSLGDYKKSNGPKVLSKDYAVAMLCPNMAFPSHDQ